jgi:hypothetical protein
VTLGILNGPVKTELVVYLARYGIARVMNEGGAMNRAWDAVFSDALGLHVSGGVSNVWTRVSGATATARTGGVSGANDSRCEQPALRIKKKGARSSFFFFRF